ncbi:hypothetical protein TNIN_295701 [Trichonephila inaurata madagascariensis]|uniref:Uncharacterized protein n=1 Tax=Trichonephila inaurata madagascariensis TaxID=2747483 RepID=A0A8X6MG01_9ARAC|nr:hypothetical protein TNIN_295701 [Trichonephila inaurata madagascariensis]
METGFIKRRLKVQHLPTKWQNLDLVSAWRKPLARISHPNSEAHWMRSCVAGKFTRCTVVASKSTILDDMLGNTPWFGMITMKLGD